ncbi:ATP-binding protein [Jatrophihabitans endophyticus]|uniref:ATP-binding protein n=1 Tax=Jatrophihabitans endophyticus TaxID=1206085 RepID=UPI0019F73DDF|nr:ATP-binding protein [Jatrophihabitans endophyticus]MBE7187898.1 ATP-binding protein [Jatrophihabitans endophyticus]
MTSTDTARPDGDVVELSTPADVVYVSTLRLAAASLAARCELTIDDIEDLRLAVDEACALLLPHATADSHLGARFHLHPGKLVVDASVTTSETSEPNRDGFAWTVLDALASTVDVHMQADTLTISVTKARESVQTL